MNNLDRLARIAVRDMPMPTSERELYPRIHATAYAIDWPNKPEALGAVFRVICETIGTSYQGQYMDRVIGARFKDCTLERAIRAL